MPSPLINSDTIVPTASRAATSGMHFHPARCSSAFFMLILVFCCFFFIEETNLSSDCEIWRCNKSEGFSCDIRAGLTRRIPPPLFLLGGKLWLNSKKQVCHYHAKIRLDETSQLIFSLSYLDWVIKSNWPDAFYPTQIKCIMFLWRTPLIEITF